MSIFSKQTTLPNIASGDFPLPEKIGPYKIKTLFKKGGMSFLYLASEQKKPLIVKILPPKLMQKEELKERFLKEASILSRASHPNIIKYFSHGEWENGLYIAMEYVKGISLREYMQKKRLDVKKALEIVQQIAYALCHLHNLGIIHNDIKPENILITDHDEIKVIDFGIARYLQGEKEKKSALVGTPFYMSKELKENPKFISTQIDIYALGMITYELLTQKTTFITLASIPKNLKNIVAKALKLNPKHAYSDMVEFITEISENIKKKESSESPSYDSLNDLLLGDKIPKIPKLSLSLAKKKIAVFDIYFDYFKIKENLYLFTLLECPDKAKNFPLVFKDLLKNAAQNFKAKPSLCSFLDFLNAHFMKSSLTPPSFSCLLFDTNKNEITFALSGHELFRFKENNLEVFSSQNPLLGSNSNTAFNEKTISFLPKDLIILPSLEIAAALKNEKQVLLKKELFANIASPIKNLAKKILLELKIKNLKRSALLLVLEKTP